MMGGMEDPRGADGVEHLQAAARELVAAARSFLDVVEDVVEDPERFQGAARGVVSLLRDGVGAAADAAAAASARAAHGGSGSAHGPDLEPWEAAAWGMSDGADRDDSAGADDAAVDTAAGVVVSADTADDAIDSDGETASTGTTRSRAQRPRGGSGRVRRVSVD